MDNQFTGPTGKSKDLVKLGFPNYRNEYFATFSVCISMICTTICISWSSTALPLLQQPNSVPNAAENIAWIISSLPIGAVPGSIISWILADFIGRRRLILYSTIPFFTSYLILAYATSVNQLLISRFIAGISVASTFTAVPIYISEIASSEIRGKLLTAFPLSGVLGFLYQFSISPHISIRQNALVCAYLPVVMFVFVYIIPETPYYLLMKNDEIQAKKALEYLRRTPNITEELIRIKAGLKSCQERNPLKLFQGTNLKSTGIVLYISSIQQLSGFLSVAVYFVAILATAGAETPVNLCGTLMALVSIPFLCVSGKLVDLYGRQKSFQISCYATAFSNFTLAAFYCCQRLGVVEGWAWVPILSLIFYKGFYVFGLGSIPFIVMTELLPTDVRAVATCIFSVVNSFLGVLNVCIYERLKAMYGLDAPFWVYGVVCVIGGMSIEFVLQETKGRTLEQIQMDLTQRKQIKQET